MLKVFFCLFSVVFFIYLMAPGPTSIRDFPALPNSFKSTLEGDTIQVPNVAGYFSDNKRNFATNYYFEVLKNKTYLPIEPLKLNYPPEYAFQAVKDQTHSTYLEEYVYPLRNSIYVNGLEPFYDDGAPKYTGAVKFYVNRDENGEYTVYDTKVTLRFYNSSIITRLLTGTGILLSIVWLWKLSKVIIYSKHAKI